MPFQIILYVLFKLVYMYLFELIYMYLHRNGLYVPVFDNPVVRSGVVSH